MTTQQHLDTLTQLAQDLDAWKERFPQVGEIIRLEKPFAEKMARFEQEEQQLNIAIMGQVKAGKSSFLNALLFEGLQVLPAAATPKTANLTRISYGEKYALEVEYYNTAEWDGLVKLAESDGQYDTALVARELVNMMKQVGIDPCAIIAAGMQRIEKESLEELMGCLNQYAGNDGQYTALVKMTRLYLPIDELKGFDVIDTPGMNDPVLSRTEKTREEMARCDVVFFLSRCGQFLDKSDMDLLANQLPQSGVKRMVLVAGQYDSAILDDGFNRNSLAETEANIINRLTRRANTEMGKLADQREQAGRSENATQLRSLTPPIFSSTFAHGFAQWSADKWADGMQKVHTELTEMAQDDWSDYEFTSDDWLRIANFNALRQAYVDAKAAKQLILQQQRDAILPEAQQQLDDRLIDLTEAVTLRIKTLETQDLASLAQQEKACEKRIVSLSGKLESLIITQLEQIKNKSKEVTQELQQNIKQFDQLKSRTGTETESESYSVSTSSWYNPFSWGSSETRYRTITVNYEYLSASDAIEQLGQYARNCQCDIEKNFNQLINQNKLKAELRRTLIDELKTSSTDFDPTQFRNTLDGVLSRLELPELDLKITDPTHQLSQNFSGEIRSKDQMQQLKQKFNQALHEVFQMLSERFATSTKQLAEQVKHIQLNLQQDLTQGVREELDNVRQDFVNQQKALAEYAELLVLIDSVPKLEAA